MRSGIPGDSMGIDEDDDNNIANSGSVSPSKRPILNRRSTAASVTEGSLLAEIELVRISRCENGALQTHELVAHQSTGC